MATTHSQARVPLSQWQRHVEAWSGCTRCGLSKLRTHVCLARGSLPCDVLFIGEAPGHSEDMIGLPFKGPAGHLLDAIIAAALGSADARPSICISNLVGCIPLDNDREKIGEPEDTSIRACAPRLQELVAMGRPRLIVCVGGLARKWFDRVIPHRTAASVDIDHPAHILRMPDAHKNLARQRAEVRLRNAVAAAMAPTTTGAV